MGHSKKGKKKTIGKTLKDIDTALKESDKKFEEAIKSMDIPD